MVIHNCVRKGHEGVRKVLKTMEGGRHEGVGRTQSGVKKVLEGGAKKAWGGAQKSQGNLQEGGEGGAHITYQESGEGGAHITYRGCSGMRARACP